MENANDKAETKDKLDAGVEHQEESAEKNEQDSGSPDQGEETAVTNVDEEVSTAEGPAAAVTEEDPRERDRQDTFARLVKGWEALAQAGARNVQRARENESFQQPLQMLQNLSLCGAGEGFSRIGGNPPATGGDPFEPIVLRHTHSTPNQYTPSMFPDEHSGQGGAPPPIRLEHMRRSSSTPASSAFRERSARSAFGTHLRSMPHLGGPDDRSAFTLPAQRNSFTSLSDSGIRYSAFDPVTLSQSMLDGASEDTSIEVMDVKPAAKDVVSPKEDDDKDDEPTSPDAPSKGAASRAARFLRMSDVRGLRRRKRRSGRENPARPPSISSSSPGDDKSKKDDGEDEETISTKSSANPSSPSRTTTKKSTIDVESSSMSRTSATVAFPTAHEADEEDNTKRTGNTSSDQYQQLDSDVDEEYEHYQRIETSLQTESPTPIPSPAYHEFDDDQVVKPVRTGDSTDVEGDDTTPTVRIHVATGQSTPDPSTPDPASANQDSSSLTPVSQDSGNQSGNSGNTSGHTTLATSTSNTVVSSSHMSVLSSVSETDIEVMETNQAGKMRIRQQRKLDRAVKRGESDGSASVYSSSTTSTNTNGYVALVGSPAPLREGASLPVDRFFDHSRIPVAHSVSTTSGSTGSSSASGPGAAVVARKTSDLSQSKKSQGSPGTVSSEMANTNSSSSTGEEPPKFVSYLDQETKSRKGVDGEERGSPAEIVGYSEMVFEAANTPPGQESQQPTLIRPMQKRQLSRDRSGRFGSRPPLSPIKGSRTPTTPPPISVVSGPDSSSPAYQQLSPPRNIVDHRMGAGLSKPYVLRSSARAGDKQTQVYVSPDADSGEKSGKIQSWAKGVVTGVGSVVSPEGPDSDAQYTFVASESHEFGAIDPHRDRIYEEMSIEVKDEDENMSEPANSIVSPEKRP